MPASEHAEAIELVLREAFNSIREERQAAVKAACLEVAESEAERCRAVGAHEGYQTALNVAMRIRRRQID